MPLDVLYGYFSAAKGLLMVEGDEQNAELRELILEQLLIRKVKSRSEQNSFDKLWGIFKDAVTDKVSFIDHCVTRLGQAVTDLILIDSNNLEGVAQFQHLTSLIYRFIHLQTNKIDILKRIMLKEENFARLESNPLPLKMFRDLFLDGSINFDIGALMQERDSNNQFSFTWLLASMLNFKYLVSLTSFLELKNQLIIYVESDVVPALIVGDKELTVTLTEALASKALTSNSYKLTLEYFVAKMVDPGEDFAEDMKPVLKVDEFIQIFDRVSRCTVD